MRRTKTVLLALALTVLTAGTSEALLETEMETAEKLIRIERYAAATKLLDEAILDDPTDAKVRPAVGKLDGSFGPKTGSVYLDRGERPVRIAKGKKEGKDEVVAAAPHAPSGYKGVQLRKTPPKLKAGET